MSLFALYQRDEPATTRGVCDQLAGNLCRCTGYRPIIEAALRDLRRRARRPFRRDGQERAAALAALADDKDVFVGDETAFFAAPASERIARGALCAHPDATLVGGATDVGLWITKQLRDLKQDHLARPGRRARPDGAKAPTGSRLRRDAKLEDAGRSSARSIPTSANHAPLRFGAGARRAARSAAMSPMARRSAICRRR